MKKQIICLVYIFLCLSSVLWAKEIKKETPTKITSDKMIYQSKTNKVIFEGDVYVWRQDFELWADKLFVYFKAKKETGSKVQGSTQELFGPDSGDIDKIVAEGRVHFIRQDKKGECARITYDPKTEEIKMEGNPRLIEGKNEICGQVIILNLKDNTSEVIGNSKQRVQAIFFTPPKKVGSH